MTCIETETLFIDEAKHLHGDTLFFEGSTMDYILTKIIHRASNDVEPRPSYTACLTLVFRGLIPIEMSLGRLWGGP